jgi:hypothetical protein
MTGLEIIGLICLIVVWILLPRTISALVIGVLIGGYWWWLFVPLAIVGLIIDCLIIKEAAES